MLKLVSEIRNPKIIEELLTFPNQPVIWHLLYGANKGKIFASEQEEGIVIIENNSEPFIFIAGKFDQEIFSAVIALCNNDPYLYCSPIYHQYFIKLGWQPFLRVQLIYNVNSPHIALDKNLSIQPIDNLEFFKKCYKFDKISKKFSSAKNFLEFGQGYALLKDKQIIGEIYSDYCGKQYVEIGIFTHPDYRKQRIATQLASYFAQKCLQNDQIPIWSCNAENSGSLKTAVKAGFDVDRYYVMMWDIKYNKNKI